MEGSLLCQNLMPQRLFSWMSNSPFVLLQDETSSGVALSPHSMDQHTFLCEDRTAPGCHKECHPPGVPSGFLSDDRIRFWYNAFQNGRTTLVDLQRNPKPKTARSQGSIQAVKAVIYADPRVTLARIQAQTGVCLGSLHSIIHKDLKLTLQCARFVPFQLTPRHLSPDAV